MPSDPRLSLLARATKQHLVSEPFPHLVIRDALEPALFERLEREYPDPSLVMEQTSSVGVRHFWRASSVVNDDRVSPLWRAFFEYHVSPQFWTDAVQLLGDEIRRLYPGLEAELGTSLETLPSEMRASGRSRRGTSRPAGVSLDCQYYLNCTREPGETARLHVDRPEELFKALLYLRDPRESVGTGGDVHFCRGRPGARLFPGSNTVRVSKLFREVPLSLVEEVETVRFEPNTLVVVLNSFRSLYSVSVRSFADWPRRHVEVRADLPGHDLFRVIVPVRYRLAGAVRRLPVVGRHLAGLGQRLIQTVGS
jgi:hypothetical protein